MIALTLAGYDKYILYGAEMEKLGQLVELNMNRVKLYSVLLTNPARRGENLDLYVCWRTDRRTKIQLSCGQIGEQYCSHNPNFV